MNAFRNRKNYFGFPHLEPSFSQETRQSIESFGPAESRVNHAPQLGAAGVACRAFARGRSRIGQSGQIVIEYVLLLAIAVMIAVLITRTLIGREEGSEGFVIKAWQALVEQIGGDHADDSDGGSRKP